MSEKNPWFESGQPARPTDIKADKADLDMRLERKALAEGWDRTADKLDATQSELAALREELAKYKQAVGEFKLTGDYHVDVNALLVEAVTARSLQTSVEQSLENRTDRVAELADERNKLQQRLAAAEQRNSDLIDLIQKAHTWVDRNNCGGWDAYELRDELAAAMNKPTESGASE